MVEGQRWPSFHEAVVLWEHFYTAHNVVSRNTEDLVNFLKRICFASDTSIAYVQAVTSGKPRDETKDAVELEVNRLVLNYLTAVATLVDISRNTMKYYEGSRPANGYAERVAKIRERGLGPLLIRLRAHVVHRARLPWVIRVYLGGQDRLLDVVLDRKEILRHGDIGGSARRYLEAFEEDVPFVHLVTEYGKELADLDDWLWAQLKILYPVPRPSDWPACLFESAAAKACPDSE
ncbi:MAG TPA: hypothetical protein VFJ94_12470 [Intrasporangium sp.]|uniref:hypothetical protein n=1 Tax=Intrasporangium sp. TaxID=1925024 RepID=UPI002D7987A0|nr:hypothetical protein [Intrasporangium sp.]HET7399324.1 hypothetical protein [Intrasporangium sp.]